jgi:hypothetical protein
VIRSVGVVFPVLFLLGVIVRVAGAGSPTTGAGVPQHVVGLGLGVLVYLTLVRRGTWRWLAALASAPVLLDDRLLALERTAGWGFLLFLLVSVTVVVLTWRPRPRALIAAYVVTIAVAAALAPWLPDPPAPAVHTASPDWLTVAVSGVLLVVAGVLALAAVAGVGRAAASGLRLAVTVMVLAPVLGIAIAPPDTSWLDAASAVVWLPAAGALGLTAVLRGRRGRAAGRPQSDEVDAQALADFRARHGKPALGPVVVVIAAYNEVDGIHGVLDDLPTTVRGLDADVIVVDDGSSDGTADAVAETRAHLCACPVNRGQGAALRLGYRLARDHGASYVITTDADGQYDVADFERVLQPLVDGRADFVTGSRILGHQHTYDRVRRLGVHVFAWIVTLLVGRRVTDTSFGLRAMRAEVTGRVTLNQPQYQSAELLLGVLSHGYRVLEVPGTMHVRSAGATKKGRNLVYGFRYARVVFGTWWREGCPCPVVEASIARQDARGRVYV